MLAIVLARAFLAGELNVDALAERAARVLGGPLRWMGPLARRFAAAFADHPHPRYREVVAFLSNDRRLRRIASRRPLITGPQPMLPMPAARSWRIPAIDSAGAPAPWPRGPPLEIDWFADRARRAPRQPKCPLE